MTRRLFVAAWVPEEAAREAAGALDRLRGTGADVKWVSPENFHVTLRFLGDVDDSGLPDLLERVTAVGREVGPFRLRLSGVGTFPGRGSPRVVWTGIDEGAREVGRLARRTERELLEGGFLDRPDPRPFRAHVTLGRPRSSRGFGRLQDLLGEMAFEGRAHLLEEVRLVESRLMPRGANYIAVARVPLSGAGAAGAKEPEGGTTT